MANLRALSIDSAGFGYQEISDADTLNVGDIAPIAGNLTVGGAAGSNVLVSVGQTLGISGATGALNLTAGADVVAAVGSILSGFDSIEGILSGNLLDKSTPETITGQWTFQAQVGTSPTLIVKQALAIEPPNTLLFQVQNSAGNNLFSVDIEGDVVIAGGETVAGATVYTGDVTLGDGGNTIQLGSAASPAVGDNVHINTTGTVDGIFSVTSAYFNLDNLGNLDLDGDLTFTSGGTITTTLNGDLVLAPHGTGVVNVTSNLNATAGLDVSGAALTSSSGLTLTVSGITMTGLDIGTALTRAGTVYCTTLDATTITGDMNSDGTNSNIWIVNEDAAAVTPEQSALISAAGDGIANLEAWQILNNPAAQTLVFRKKTNPTDLKSLVEAGYTTYITINSSFAPGVSIQNAPFSVVSNGINLDGTLSFAGVAASVIDTSGNNPLSITVGNNTLTFIAGLVDLNTNVTSLDIPSGTGLSIGGVALTTANFTAANVDTLLDGSNADALHVHSGTAAGQVVVGGLTTAGMAQYQAGYVSANNTVSPTVASSGGGSFTSATFAGVYSNVAGEIVNHGKVEVQFDAGLTAPAAGQPAVLSWINNGQFRNDVPASGSGHWFTRAGVILDASTYGANQRCTVVIQPDRPIRR